MSRWEAALPWVRPPLSANRQLHHHVKAPLVRQIKRDVQLMARSVRFPTGLVRVRIELHWDVRDGRRRDTDNMAPTLKALIDGLVDYGLVADDNAQHVSSECFINRGERAGCRMVVEMQD